MEKGSYFLFLFGKLSFKNEKPTDFSFKHTLLHVGRISILNLSKFLQITGDSSKIKYEGIHQKKGTQSFPGSQL